MKRLNKRGFTFGTTDRIQPRIRIWLTCLCVVLCTAMAPNSYAAEKVWCSCPTIKADGKGTTNCTANESNGRCTIDYNVFGSREIRTAEVLQEHLDTPFTPYSNVGIVEALRTAETKGELHKQIQLYLMIATVDQMDTYPESVPKEGFSEVQTYIEKYQEQIRQAFAHDNVGHFSAYGESDALSHGNLLIIDTSGVVISPGCISVKTSSVDVMFKTFWAPARWFPRCRKPS